MKNFGKYAVTALSMGILAAALSGCDEGPAEKAGKQIDKAVDKTGQQLDKAGDKIGDAVNDKRK